MATAPLRQPSSAYLAQSGLAVAFARVLRREWPQIDRASLYALLTRFSQASATIAAQDYAARRAEAGIRSQFTVPLAAAPTPDHAASTLDWVYADAEADQKAAEDRLVASFTRLALQSGRITVVAAVRDDKQARAWAREARADCCYFCAMLASRGAVYKDEGAAGRDANAGFTGDGEFKFHNNCHCTAVPVFGAYEKSADARAWTRRYHDLKRELGRAPSLLEWRQQYEGRLTTDDPQSAGN